MPTRDLSAGLRSRLLYSLIGLAVVVSAIFSFVAYNLSSDLGESLEIKHKRYVFSQFIKHITENINEASADGVLCISEIRDDLI